jgi:hypothetical protein
MDWLVNNIDVGVDVDVDVGVGGGFDVSNNVVVVVKAADIFCQTLSPTHSFKVKFR